MPTADAMEHMLCHYGEEFAVVKDPLGINGMENERFSGQQCKRDPIVNGAKQHGMEESMENRSKGSNKKVILGVAALAVVIVILAVVYNVFREKPVEGSKSITIEVVNKAQVSRDYRLKTDAEYLRQAMEEADGLTFSGTESEYGLMVDTVNGETADYSVDGSYWSFYVNGEYCNYGIDTQPVVDGDVFSIVYTVD